MVKIMKISINKLLKKFLFFLDKLLKIFLFFFFLIQFGFIVLYSYVNWINEPMDKLNVSRASLLDSIDSEGNFPKTPEDLDALDNTSIKLIDYLKEFYYIGGLSTNDPYNTPIILKQFHWHPLRGGMITINNNTYSYTQIKRKQWDELIKEPWKLLENGYATPEEYMSFTNRLRLYKVSKTGSELITPKANQ